MKIQSPAAVAAVAPVAVLAGDLGAALEAVRAACWDKSHGEPALGQGVECLFLVVELINS